MRDEILDLSMRSRIVRNGIMAFTNGRATYIEALEAIVLAQDAGNEMIRKLQVDAISLGAKPGRILIRGVGSEK